MSSKMFQKYQLSKSKFEPRRKTLSVDEISFTGAQALSELFSPMPQLGR